MRLHGALKSLPTAAQTSSTAGRLKALPVHMGPNAAAVTNLVGKDEKIYEIVTGHKAQIASHKAFVTWTS